MNIRPAVIMMVRDEADIIEQAINAWEELGVSDFYICDNGSADNTLNVIDRWMEWHLEHVCMNISHDTATDWPGRRVINQLKNKAIDDGCNWIFPADADEFLGIPEGLNLDDWIKSLNTESGWGEIPYLNIMPDGKKNWQEPHRKAFGVITKEMTISMGNHLVEETPATIKAHGAYYRHYSMRSYPQFKKKMENYMKAFNQTMFQDHHHAVDFHLWQAEGEAFLMRRWEALTGLKP